MSAHEHHALADALVQALSTMSEAEGDAWLLGIEQRAAHARSGVPAPVSLQAQVRRALRSRGYTLSSWAREHGFAYSTVVNAINRHAGGHARDPWGAITYNILLLLSQELGQEITPGIPADSLAGQEPAPGILADAA